MQGSETEGISEAAAIARGIRAGDAAAERRLFAQYRSGVVLMLRRRLTDRSFAEDVANDTLSEALRILRERCLEEPDNLAAFVHGIAANLARNANRKEARQRTDSDTEAVEATLDVSGDPASLNMRASLARVVRELLSSLPVDRDRQILMRLYLNDDDKEDICRDMSLSREHFDRVVHRARQRMRAHIEGVGPKLRLRDLLGIL
jgi:RNA polymerase sigma-70 factor (ECF subfamily)